MVVLLAGLLLWFTPGRTHALPLQDGYPGPVIIDGSVQSFPLAGRSIYWIDPTGQLEPDEIEARQDLLPWSERTNGQRVTLGESAALWIRFDAWVQHDDVHWELELARSGTDHIALH